MARSGVVSDNSGVGRLADAVFVRVAVSGSDGDYRRCDAQYEHRKGGVPLTAASGQRSVVSSFGDHVMCIMGVSRGGALGEICDGATRRGGDTVTR